MNHTPTGKNEEALIGIVVLVVVAAVLYVALLSGYISDLTDVNSTTYVGASLAGIVGIVPIFYWLMVAFVVIGAAMVAFKHK